MYVNLYLEAIARTQRGVPVALAPKQQVAIAVLIGVVKVSYSARIYTINMCQGTSKTRRRNLVPCSKQIERHPRVGDRANTHHKGDDIPWLAVKPRRRNGDEPITMAPTARCVPKKLRGISCRKDKLSKSDIRALSKGQCNKKWRHRLILGRPPDAMTRNGNKFAPLSKTQRCKDNFKGHEREQESDRSGCPHRTCPP